MNYARSDLEARAGAVPALGAGLRSLSVTVERLVKSFGPVGAVRGIDFVVAPGSTVTLLGPSGCGKTTTLRCIAGLEVPTAGRIRVGDQVVYDEAGIFIEPERRNIGMVFQSYAIWPHMSVGGNVSFPLTIAGVSKRESRDRTPPFVPAGTSTKGQGVVRQPARPSWRARRVHACRNRTEPAGLPNWSPDHHRRPSCVPREVGSQDVL